MANRQTRQPDPRRPGEEPATLGRAVGKREPFDSPAQEAYLNLARTHERLASDFARLFRQHQLSSSTYNVLRILRGAGSPGLACGDIAQRIIVPAPDVTRLIDRLERLGLVEREGDPDDRRVILVRLSRAGHAKLRKLDQPVDDLHRRQLSHMNEDQLRELNRLLELARNEPPPEQPGNDR